MIIEGANIGKKNVEYKKLSNYEWTNNEKLNNIIKKLEVLYQKLEEETNNYSINPMHIDKEDKVVIPKNALNHRCSSSINSLNEISKHGLLASEWFGELESEREGCFCAFLSVSPSTTLYWTSIPP